jgi:hypothetical protein
MVLYIRWQSLLQILLYTMACKPRKGVNLEKMAIIAASKRHNISLC